MTSSLDNCIFCGNDDMTEEHIVADWVLRAFFRSKTTRADLSGSFIGPKQMRVGAAEPIATAKVICRACNNEWLSQIDNRAAQALRPLVQGRSEVTLSPDAQSAVSAWIFKCALIFDASQNGAAGPLSPLRADFAQHRLAPPGSTIYAGPAPPLPITVPGIPEIAGLALFGVRPTQGNANVTINIKHPDGTTTTGAPKAFPTPGWTVMLGPLHAIISGLRGPIIPTPEWKFQCLWPASTDPVTLTSVPRKAPKRPEG